MKIGYQLFSAAKRYNDSESLLETIRKIGAAGFDGVEFFLYMDTPAEKMKEVLEESHLAAINSHVQIERWEKDPTYEIAYAKTLGMQYLTVPFVLPPDRTKEYYDALLPKVKVWEQMCRKEGIELLWHNHDFEFEKTDGIYLMDRILDYCPNLGWEIDSFWVYYAGLDAKQEMEQRKERLRLVHVKDFIDKDTKPHPTLCAMGTGKMDNEVVVETARTLGIEWIIAEQDNTQLDEFDDAVKSMEKMKLWR